jgi:Family of unknown function (DUF5670)
VLIRRKQEADVMSWTIVCLFVGVWVLGLLNGYSFGGLIHILLVYAGLMVIARLLETHRSSRNAENSQPGVEPRLTSKNS